MWPALVGAGGAILGGLLGKSQNPTIDPRILAQLFGPGALSKDTNALYQMLVNSPAWSQMMNQAAIQGSQTRNQTQANLAQSGLGGTPYGAFLNAAGGGYTGTLQRQGRQQLFADALRAAFEGLQSRQSAYVNSRLQRQEQPTWGRMIGSSLLNAGAQGMSGAWG